MVWEGVSVRGQSHKRAWLLDCGGCGRARLWDGTVWLWESVAVRGLAVECVLKRGVVMGCGPEWVWLLRGSSKS